jgi:D-amino-acid dehydrogenase
MGRTALVVGGGLIGVTTAWYLAERGFQVTVLERREATALETSYANGGLVTPSQSDPWNGPGTFIHLLKWLGREDSPLLLRPRALPGLWRWGLKFLWASRAAPWWRSTEANLRLGLYSVAALGELRQRLGLEYESLSRGTLKVFRDPQAFERSVVLARSLAPLGLDYRALTAAEAAALEPLLEPIAARLAGAIHYPTDESGDAHLFTRALEKHAREAGVRFEFGRTVLGFNTRQGHVTGARVGEGTLQADVYVLAAASLSPRLTRPLGLELPIYPVKGYSVTLPAAGWKRPLTLPLVDFEQKVVITPLGGRLRIAGTAEFAGYDDRLNPRRGANILRHALDLLPEIAAQTGHAEVQNWTGLRPMTPDGPPILGATPYPNLFLNTGHGPLGWTLGAGSARALADLMSGQPPELDLAPFSFARFAR